MAPRPERRVKARARRKTGTARKRVAAKPRPKGGFALSEDALRAHLRGESGGDHSLVPRRRPHPRGERELSAVDGLHAPRGHRPDGGEARNRARRSSAGTCWPASRKESASTDSNTTSTTKSGDKRHGMASVEKIEIGGHPCLLAFTLDVTDRRRLEHALVEKTEFLDRLLENAPVPIYAVEQPKGRVLMVNRAWEEIGVGCAEATRWAACPAISFRRRSHESRKTSRPGSSRANPS